MRRMIIGLGVSVVVVAGLPAVVSAGGEVIEHPPIDCYGGNGFNSEFVSDVDWGFPCVAYDGESPVAETSVTKLYPLWDGSRKLVAKFYGDDPGLSSGDACRLPDGTVTTETWVHRWFWKTTVVCKAPPPPECSMTLPEGLLRGYAYSDVNTNLGSFDPGVDVWIAAVLEIGEGEYELLLNCYPLDFDISGFGTFADRGPFPVSNPTVNSGSFYGEVGTFYFELSRQTAGEFYRSEPVSASSPEVAFIDGHPFNLPTPEAIVVEAGGLGDPSDTPIDLLDYDTSDAPFINVVFPTG